MNDTSSSPPSNFDIKKLYKRSAVDLNKKPKKPPVCYEIGGIPVGTYGNFSVITGKAKSKKTFLVSLIVASLLSENYSDNLISSSKKIDNIIFIDTEQSKFDVYSVAQRMITKSKDKKRLKVFSLRSLKILDRNKLLTDIVENTKPNSLIIIDGLRDLVTSVNDEEQASTVNDFLLQGTEVNKIHIIGVIHQNKGNDNVRGHLGTELINKAESVISVKIVDKITSAVSAKYSRREAFPDFQFTINEDSIPLIDNYLIKKKNSRRKKLPHKVEYNTHKLILTSISKITSGKRPNYNEIVELIREEVSSTLEEIGNSKAKEYFKYYKDEGFITQKGIKHTTDSYYEIDI